MASNLGCLEARKTTILRHRPTLNSTQRAFPCSILHVTLQVTTVLLFYDSVTVSVKEIK